MGQKMVATGNGNNDTPIEDLVLSVRAYNCLKRSNIVTVGQLLSVRKEDLPHIRNLTPQNYEEIREQLIAHGFLPPTQLTWPLEEDER